MLETDLFWTFITILSTVIEWIVLRFLLEEISKLKKSKIQFISKMFCYLYCRRWYSHWL